MFPKCVLEAGGRGRLPFSSTVSGINLSDLRELIGTGTDPFVAGTPFVVLLLALAEGCGEVARPSG